MFKQSILNYANQVSRKCSCGRSYIVEVNVTLRCKGNLEGHGCNGQSPLPSECYEVLPGEQFVLFLNADKSVSTFDILEGVSSVNEKIKKERGFK